MKRIIISITIITVIIAIGCSAIFYIDSQNQKLYGKIEMVKKAYTDGAGVEESISGLQVYFDGYIKGLSCIVPEDELMEISEAIAKLLPMYQSDCDEFLAECEAIKNLAGRIRSNEVPTWHKIL